MNIKKLLDQENLSIEDLINCFEVIKDNGDVAVIKFDGQRSENKYTIFIIFSQDPTKEMIRIDDSDLKNGLISVLKRYIALE